MVLSREFVIGALGAVFVFFYFLHRFNTWTPDEPKAKSGYPPRNFTTWCRYYRYSLLYILINETFYTLIIFFPDVMAVLLEIAENSSILEIQGYDKDIFLDNAPLWSTIIVTALLPSLPKKINPDYYLRGVLHKSAVTPGEAENIVDKLNLEKSFHDFEPDEILTGSILEKKENHLTREDFLVKKDTLNHKWAKLCYLENKFKTWKTKADIHPVMDAYDSEWEQLQKDIHNFRESYASYSEYLNKLQDSGKSPQQDGIANTLHRDLNASLSRQLSNIYTLITCGTLAATKYHAQRMSEFREFGLQYYESRGLPFDWETLIKIIGMAFVATLIPSLIYLSLFDPAAVETHPDLPVPKLIRGTAYWSFISLFLQGGAVFIAIYINRIWIRNQSSEPKTNRDQRFRVIKSVPGCAVSAAGGYAIGFIVILVFALIGGTSSIENYGVLFEKIAPWPLLSAVTAYFVTYFLGAVLYMDEDDTKKARSGAWRFAWLQGSVSGFTGAIATLFFFNHFPDRAELAFLLFVVSITFIIGFGIGYILPEGYRKLHSDMTEMGR